MHMDPFTVRGFLSPKTTATMGLQCESILLTARCAARCEPSRGGDVDFTIFYHTHADQHLSNNTTAPGAL